MKILGIETSCDETAAAIVENGDQILSNVVVSQIDIFASYGGVISENSAPPHPVAHPPGTHRASPPHRTRRCDSGTNGASTDDGDL